jgi:hypothetical protein
MSSLAFTLRDALDGECLYQHLALLAAGRMVGVRVIADAGLLHAGAAPASPATEEVQAILDTRGPGGITASDPIWLTGFSINERKV